jgi:uracil-DNA glycosylase family 4
MVDDTMLDVNSVEDLHRRILACRLCAEAGWIDRAAPVVAGQPGNRMMLIGQAPGQTEVEARRPFHGRAGRELFRWMASIGIDEDEFRKRVYMTAVTKCFPGKATSGTGDRRPSPREIALCSPFLEEQFSLIAPQTLLLTGGLAIDLFFRGQALNALIGKRFEENGMSVIPLPHPSGASRWLNLPEHRALLRHALILVQSEWKRLIED